MPCDLVITLGDLPLPLLQVTLGRDGESENLSKVNVCLENEMADYSISYGEWESRPVFNITAKCGHSYQVFRQSTDTIETFIRRFG